MGQNLLGLACALTVCLAAGRGDAHEEQEENEKLNAPITAEERITRVLDGPLITPLEFDEMPLSGVLGVIAEEYELPIQFDRAALDAIAESPEREVSVNISGKLSVRSALNLLFANMEDVTYIIDNEVLLVTTEDEAATHLEVRVYRVDDLRSLSTNERPAAGGASADYDILMGVITDFVEPDTWVESGHGDGEIQFLKPGMYVVLQTVTVHQKIEKLLGEIRGCKAAIESDEKPAESDEADDAKAEEKTPFDDF